MAAWAERTACSQTSSGNRAAPPAPGNLKDRLHQSRRHHRAKTVVPEHHDGPLDALDRLRADTIEGAVGHLQEASDQRRIARDDGHELPHGHALVIDGVHQLGQKIRTPREVILLRCRIADGGQGGGHDLLMRAILDRSRSAIVEPELHLPEPAASLGVIEELRLRGRLQHRRLGRLREVGGRVLARDLRRATSPHAAASAGAG